MTVKKKITFASLPENPKVNEEKIVVPEWNNGTFSIREVTADQNVKAIEKIQSQKIDKDGNPKELGNFEAGVILLTISLFDEDEQNPSYEWLMKQPVRLINNLSTIALRLNRIDIESQILTEKN